MGLSVSIMVIFHRRCLSDPMSVYFNASRDKEYDRGGEEILKYDRMLINAGNQKYIIRIARSRNTNF